MVENDKADDCNNTNDDAIAAELDSILDSYADDETRPQDNVLNEEQEQEFLARFERIKVEVIKPTMEEIGKYLERKGHSYQIKDNASPYHDENPIIKMEIYPKISAADDGRLQEHEFPTIAFIAEPDIATVGIEVRDGMPRRPGLTRGHTTNLESLTKEYVRNQIITVIKMNFVKRPARKNSD
ncbi:hypothetical protein NTE_03498 [Candidatus Nitrososphaera evergladensis SR1]|uniref:Uncharacterized protein n=1 Tax=Candidatus Nitrososphaera evergladensis SR1 TaxID=1459636 RepID=A0A075MV46_9ARCH|nr:hypothetical protein [Candidatus Nitrososphaera evergladensis]AIF85526.1 hypothetical protein NTE_03498 [Candidatus Nitrososphaera evergladensis SR1]